MLFPDALVLLYQAMEGERAITLYKRNGRWEEDGATPALLRDLVGLRNRTGEHNCFLNVDIQTIWAFPALLDIFGHLPPQLEGDFTNVPMHAAHVRLINLHLHLSLDHMERVERFCDIDCESSTYTFRI